MELQRPDLSTRPPGCNRLFKGCIVLVALLLIVFLALVIYVVRMPSLQAVAKCKINIEQVGAALERYREVNGEYPPTLEPIEKEYLKDPAVLRCPLCHPKAKGFSYDYFRPGPKAKDDFVMLQCDLHKASPGMPVRKIKLQKNGTVTFETLSPEEIVKESKKVDREKGAVEPRPSGR